MISLATTSLCLLAFATTDASAAWEVDDGAGERAAPRATTLVCDKDLTDAQTRACEDAVMRWRLCQRIYISHPNADDAFYACFDGSR